MRATVVVQHNYYVYLFYIPGTYFAKKTIILVQYEHFRVYSLLFMNNY